MFVQNLYFKFLKNVEAKKVMAVWPPAVLLYSFKTFLLFVLKLTTKVGENIANNTVLEQQ